MSNPHNTVIRTDSNNVDWGETWIALLFFGGLFFLGWAVLS